MNSEHLDSSQGRVGKMAQEQLNAQTELMEMTSTEIATSQGFVQVLPWERGTKPFGSDNYTDRSTEFTSHSFSSRNTSFTNSVGVPTSIYGFGIVPEDSDNGSIASSCCATHTSNTRPTERRKNDHIQEYDDAGSASNLAFRAPTAPSAFLATPQKSALFGSSASPTPTSPWGFNTQPGSLSPPVRNSSASANLCSAPPMWSIEGYRIQPTDISGDGRPVVNVPLAGEDVRGRVIPQLAGYHVLSEAMQDCTDQELVGEIHHVEDGLPHAMAEGDGGLEVRVGSDSSVYGGEDDDVSIGTSLAVEVASLDDEGTYVGYGEEAEDDVSTCADSSLPPRTRSRHHHSSSGGGCNSDLDGDAGYFLWAEDGAEELVRESGNCGRGRWGEGCGEDEMSQGKSDTRSAASRKTPPALRHSRPRHSPSSQLDDAQGCYQAYPTSAARFSTDQLSDLDVSDGHQEARLHSDFARGYEALNDLYDGSGTSKSPRGKCYALKSHRDGHRNALPMEEGGGDGAVRSQSMSGQKRSRSAGSNTTSSSRATGKRKR